jgi:hypothetical protein
MSIPQFSLSVNIFINFSLLQKYFYHFFLFQAYCTPKGGCTMVMSWIFTGILMVSFFFAAMLGRGSELAAAIPTGAQAGISLAISMAGSICLWTGVGKLMEKAGMTGKLACLLSPGYRHLFLFPIPIIAGFSWFLRKQENKCGNPAAVGV